MKTNQFFRAFLGMVAVCGSQTLWAENDADKLDPAKLTQDLCQSQAEGLYRAVLPNEEVQVEIICTGQSKILATVYSNRRQIASTMVHLSIEGSKVVFLSYDPSADQVPGGMPLPELVLDIEALKRGEMVGEHTTARFPRPLAFSVKKEFSFPNLASLANSDRDWTMVPGRYIVEVTRQLKPMIVPPAYLSIKIRNGIQRILINDQSAGLGLLNGLTATADKNFGDVFAGTWGVDDTLFGKVIMTHVRGHMLSKDELEFWYINSEVGMAGPFKAKRDTAAAMLLPISATVKTTPRGRGRHKVIARPH